MADLISTK
jgi:hypothetical protein